MTVHWDWLVCGRVVSSGRTVFTCYSVVGFARASVLDIAA